MVIARQRGKRALFLCAGQCISGKENSYEETYAADPLHSYPYFSGLSFTAMGEERITDVSLIFSYDQSPEGGKEVGELTAVSSNSQSPWKVPDI